MTIMFSGQGGVSKYEKVLACELVDLKAGSYHKLTFAKGIELMVNDFGVRMVLKVPDGVSQYDLPNIS